MNQGGNIKTTLKLLPIALLLSLVLLSCLNPPNDDGNTHFGGFYQFDDLGYNLNPFVCFNQPYKENELFSEETTDCIDDNYKAFYFFPGQTVLDALPLARFYYGTSGNTQFVDDPSQIWTKTNDGRKRLADGLYVIEYCCVDEKAYSESWYLEDGCWIFQEISRPQSTKDENGNDRCRYRDYYTPESDSTTDYY